MIDPKDEVFRDLDDQGRSDDNNRIHDEPGFLGDEEQNTESGNVAVEREDGHEIPKAMTIEQEGEKPWELNSGSTNLTQEQLEEVSSPATNPDDEENPAIPSEAAGSGYHEEPDQLKVGGEE